MKSLTKAGTLVAIKRIGQGLVLLSLLALLALLGTGVSHPRSALYPQPSDPEPGSSAWIAATNGTIHVGGATTPALAATNGDIDIDPPPTSTGGAGPGTTP